MKKSFSKFLLWVAALHMGAVTSLAQSQVIEANTALNNVNSELTKIVSSVMSIAMVLIVIVLTIGAVIVLPKYIKGDHESQDAIIKWGGGLLFALIALAILKQLLVG